MGTKYSFFPMILILGITLSMVVITPSLLTRTGTNIVNAQPSPNNTSSNNNNNSNSSGFLSYETQPPYAHRSAVEEWAPHQQQSNYTQEWWYTTALFNDAQGNMYSLLFVDMKIDGSETPFAMLNPALFSTVKPTQTMTMCMLGFSAYDSNFRTYSVYGVNDNKSDMWDAANNAVNFHCKDTAVGSWGYNGTDSKLVLKSQNITLDLDMVNNHPVMWTKDSVYNTQGVLQEGGPGNFSYYYSLPRLEVTGNISYIDKAGHNKTMDVTGQGWIDKQWGDWNVRAWEWNSLRFDNGARVNLYSFGNALEGGLAYLVGTYQKADGSLQYFNNFTVKQEGYAKNPISGNWISFGWGYDFPIDIEGSKHYSAVPFSNQFTNMPPVEWIWTYAAPGKEFRFVEQGGQVINNDTGEVVGSTFSESMPIQLLQNGPYEVNQH